VKKIILCAFVLCALAAAAVGARAGVWQGRRDAGVYYREGTRYAVAGRLDEAAAAFEQAVRLDPKNGDAYFSLGNVYSEQGRWDDAVAAYEKAVALRKKDGEAHNNLGVALGRRGEYERAAAAFERAIEIFPDWAEPRFHLSQVYKKLGRDVAGQVAYAEALERRPDYATQPPRSFMTEAAKVSTVPRRESAAVKTPTPAPVPPPRAADPAPVAARPDPDEDDATQYEIGLRHSRAGRHEEAVAALRQAVRLDRDNAAAYSALGGAYARLGRWRESVDAYEQAVRLDPRDVNAYEMLGRSYAKLRETMPAAPSGAETAEGVRAATNSGASSGAPPPAESAPPAPAPAPVDADPTAVYRVGPGDVLEVRVPGGRASQAAAHKITPTGMLDYPRLGEPLKVSGLTTDEVAQRLGAELKRRGAAVAAPGVSVGVLEYASHAVILSGLVKDPGTKILRREGIPLYVIIAHAQPQPSAGQALVMSKATGRSTAVNLRDTAAMKMLVYPGDVIDVQVLPKQFYYVAGAVRQPGQKEFHLGLTLTQAVLAAGGVVPRDASVVTVTRQGGDGRLATTRYSLREIEAGRTPDPAVQPGDRLEVQK
jgi:tetratricopeptide (TPR) repeat protein/protein involved in polysaccharide export with SLBB domain